MPHKHVNFTKIPKVKPSIGWWWKHGIQEWQERKVDINKLDFAKVMDQSPSPEGLFLPKMLLPGGVPGPGWEGSTAVFVPAWTWALEHGMLRSASLPWKSGAGPSGSPCVQPAPLSCLPLWWALTFLRLLRARISHSAWLPLQERLVSPWAQSPHICPSAT